jgi:hypothetical protein
VDDGAPKAQNPFFCRFVAVELERPKKRHVALAATTSPTFADSTSCLKPIIAAESTNFRALPRQVRRRRSVTDPGKRAARWPRSVERKNASARWFAAVFGVVASL